ncbi:MAG: ThuA domain-containing protein [Candidatus Sericytochromatia bacterium]|uniref:ThuA domain-containing protein n=1 Tax=Candidatus Tanganyikabacteria bacterium TaxID=2961651 RepID=A0A938BNK8_9BACT|nr:ThuA domain-containing protein [Candidatus Tanganyikabacteria bacterium]
MIAAAPPSPPAYEVLVFTRTEGYRHDAIPDAVAAMREIGAGAGFRVDATEDPATFDPVRLKRYRAVVFLLTSGDVLDPGHEAALQEFVRQGGGFVGVHSACDTEYGWPWYGHLVGTRFAWHPWIQQATVRVVADHPSTRGLPREWPRTDEWYNYRHLPAGVTVVASLDERTYWGGWHGRSHPVAWYRDFEGGRTFYTAMGHTRESYADPLFKAHLAGAIRFAAGVI